MKLTKEEYEQLITKYPNLQPTSMITITCLECNIAFEAHASQNRIYCSPKCAYSSADRVKHIKPKERGSRICARCSTVFKLHRASGKGIYCSQECAAMVIGKITMSKNRQEKPAIAQAEFTCKQCGVKFMAWSGSKRVYCSQPCSSKGNEGKAAATMHRNGYYRSAKPYSRAKAQWVTLGGIKFYARSQWEANYAHYLEFQKQQSLITSWQHEPETFWFKGIKRGVCSYLPDFKIENLDKTSEFHEVKGWMDAKSKTKIRRMKKYHPKTVLIVRDSAWFKANQKQLSQLVPGWKQ